MNKKSERKCEKAFVGKNWIWPSLLIQSKGIRSFENLSFVVFDKFVQLKEVEEFSNLKQSKRVLECHTNLPPKKIIHHSEISQNPTQKNEHSNVHNMQQKPLIFSCDIALICPLYSSSKFIHFALKK